MRSRLQILSLLLVLLLTACSSAEPEKPPADPQATLPAPDPATAEEIQSAPFDSYFDLSGLSQETLDGSLQDIEQENTADGVTVRVHQTIGDGQNVLYVAFDVYPVSPENTSLPSPELTVEGSVSAPLTGVSVFETRDGTHSYLATFSQLPASYAEKEIAFSLVTGTSSTPHTFTWRSDNSAALQEAAMLDEAGEKVGTAQLTPFSLVVHMDDTSIDGFQENTVIALLGEDGSPLPETWSVSGDLSYAFFEFFKPMEPGTIHTLQLGPYTGRFS